MKILKNTTKSIPNQQNPYQYEQIDIQKIISNLSKFQNPKFGEIANHKRTNLEVRCGNASSRVDVWDGGSDGWSSSGKKKGGIWFGV